MRSAFSTVEAVLASAVFGLLSVALASAYLYGQEATVFSGNESRAAFLAEEGLEAARNMRDSAFANLTDGSHGLAVTANQWTWSGASDTNGIFTRSVAVSTVDANRKDVTSTVTWQQNAQRTGSVSTATRLTNWLASGMTDWSAPKQVGATAISGSQNGFKVEIVGNYAYVVRNVSTSGNFICVDISNPAAPSVVGTYSVSGAPANVYVSGNYAYVTTNNATQKLQIINISNPASPTLAGAYTVSSSYGGIGVFVSGNYAYVTMSGGTNFLAINVSNPASPTLAGSATITGTLSELVVSGNYAYVTSSSSTAEFQVMNISNPASPTRVYTMDMSGTTAASRIAISRNTVLVGRGASVETIDVTTPTAPLSLGSVSVVGTVNDIALNFTYGGARALVANSDSVAELKVVDISAPNTPSVVGSFNYSGSLLRGIAYSPTLDVAVSIGSATTGVIIIGP